ncbi:MAG: hybrid sensor histidine kinase/response regulator [Elusimicrobia bacterium]|nr:hybrid sensor histidine kinase/response regulator [Elusimicrobiota bacterium]
MDDAKAKVLVCDDEKNMRDTIRDNLEDAGYEVTEVATGPAAVAAAGKGAFDVILMDYKLMDPAGKESMTGIEAIKQIRMRDTESQILMLTGHASLDIAVQSIQESVYDFIQKPVDIDYLKRRIGQATDKLRLQRENKRLIEELRQKNSELSSLNDMKSKFMSMASHDLSNALMTLQVSFEMLSSTLVPDAEQKKRMTYISSGINQIRRLVEDLVDWASIEQGKFRLEKDWFSPAALVEEIVIGPQGRAAARGLSLKAQVNGSLPMVLADRRRISQVINNLLENAIRHTMKGGSVTLAVEAKGRDALFSVRDTGEGIAPEDHEKIFQSFCQGSSQQERGRLGLGLSISKEIVESHGGAISVASPGPGKGATFSFTLPFGEKPKS